MSEFVKRHERGIARALWAGFAGAVALSGVMVAGEVAHKGPLYESKYPKTGIVTGAPMQVEEHGPLPEEGRRQVPHYQLRVEQCPADVAAAQQGQTATSFNPDLNKHNPGCVDTWIDVNADTYQRHPDGSTLVLAGPVGDPVREF